MSSFHNPGDTPVSDFNDFAAQPNATNLETPALKIRADEPTRSKGLSLTLALLFFLYSSARVFSQTVTASTSGVCLDDHGAVLTGVTVVIKNIETGIRPAAVTV